MTPIGHTDLAFVRIGPCADDDLTGPFDPAPGEWRSEPSIAWTMDELEPDPLPRYQIHVELAEGESIPGRCLDL